MDIFQLKHQMDEDEKKALIQRVNGLYKIYTEAEIEKIVFSELDEIGLRSEYYLDLMEDVLKAFR